MIGAVIFVIFFVIFLLATLGIPTLPPGDIIRVAAGIQQVDYPVLGIPAWLLIDAIINGVIFGFVIWLIYSLASYATRSRKEQRPVSPTTTTT